MSLSKKISRLQLQKMADFFEEYPKLFRGTIEKDFSKTTKEQLWQELAEILNAGQMGPKRSSDKWRKCFKDYKHYVKKKYEAYLQDPTKPIHFDYLDGRYLRMLGYENLQGIDETVRDFKNSCYHSYMLEEGVTDSAEYKEQNHKFYQAPNIITILQAPGTDAKRSERAPTRQQSPSVERTQSNDLSSSSRNSTAEALQAIAKEMGVKNKLAKRKIELLEESLLLERRKIEAFELIAKRLRKDS